MQQCGPDSCSSSISVRSYRGSIVLSASKNVLAWPSMDSEKSAAMTALNFPLLAKRLEKSPLPQLMSTKVCKRH